MYLLGKGTFGQVVCCRNHKWEKVAVKVIKNKQNFYKQALFEAKILKTINKEESEKYKGGERVVKMLDVFLWRNHLCIVFEVLERSLYDLCNEGVNSVKEGNFEGINLIWIQHWTHYIVKGLFHTHELGIIHCDLKP